MEVCNNFSVKLYHRREITTMESQIILFTIALFLCITHGKVTVKKFQMCEPDKDYAIKFTQKLKTENDMQIVEEGSMSAKVPLDDNVKIVAKLYSKEDDGQYHYIISIGDSICNALNKYLGDFGYELQKAAGLEPGQCPIPAGEYKVKDHPLDFSKFKYKNVPKGELKIEGFLLDVNTNDTLGCTDAELSLE